jgi:hypothetical protein
MTENGRQVPGTGRRAAGDVATVPPGPAPSSEVVSGSEPVRRARDHRGSWIPPWSLVAMKQLELRRRRGLMFAVLLLTLGLPFIVLGLRLLFHAFDPHSYGPAGSPSVFEGLSNPMADFGFIIAATVGATAATTDLSDGVFRHLVITGRSRLAFYLARIPAGLSILLPLVAIGFAALCLVTVYEGVSQPTSVSENGISIPVRLDESQLKAWLLQRPDDAEQAFSNGPVAVIVGKNGVPTPVLPGRAKIRSMIDRDIATIYGTYTSDEASQLNPAPNEMVKIGLWIVLDVAIGFLVGLGLGSLTGQRTLSAVLLIVLQIIVTPILAGVAIPYFLDGQRLVIGVAMDQLRPAALASGTSGHGGRVLFGGRALGIPPMPTWAMISVIVGWVVVWSALGAWRMATRDA